jgi:hypothetical protein
MEYRALGQAGLRVSNARDRLSPADLSLLGPHLD